MELKTLKTMCELLTISRRSIQCYEKEGLMSPTDKNKYGYLLYDDKAVERAKKIRFMRQIGFKLKEVRDLIDAPVSVLKKALEEKVVELEFERERLDLISEAQEYIQKLN